MGPISNLIIMLLFKKNNEKVQVALDYSLNGPQGLLSGSV